MGVPYVAVLEDGDAIVLDGGSTTVERGAVPAGYVFLDGDSYGSYALNNAVSDVWVMFAAPFVTGGTSPTTVSSW